MALLNRVGVGNAEVFLQKLKFAEHQELLLQKLDELLSRISSVLEKAKSRISWLVPDRFTRAIESVQEGVAWLKAAAPQRLKDAIKELDDFLREIQNFVRSGGETTSRTTAHAAETGAKEVHRTDELILLEGKAAKRTVKGGWAQNSPEPKKIGAVYEHEPGFPDLRDNAKGWTTADPLP